MATASKSIPFAVPPQRSPKPESVTPDKLALITLRLEIERLEKKLGLPQRDLSCELEADASINPRSFHASLKIVERASVSREVVIKCELAADTSRGSRTHRVPSKYIQLAVTT